ncbi:MAG TPA: M28 family metallopeptidase [Rhizomicrobium sp.]|nr:M28 family metallopeptidase [Rhizomicrobium sp.]
MTARFALLFVLLALSFKALAADPVAQWWADVSALADDAMEGRQTGSPGYDRAAAYVISRLKQEGLKPAGSDGYLQPVGLEQQLVDQDQSRALLLGADGNTTPLKVGDEMLISAGGGPRPAQIDAPLVFIGYGLHLPQQGHDDFAGQDLKGKIVVLISGGPDTISGPVKSDARSARNKALAKAGAIGVLALTTPKQVEILWSRQKLLARQPGMYLADAGLRDTADQFFTAAFDPAQTELLFKGSGHSFAELCALADASKPVPRFALPVRLKAEVAAARSPVTSPNIVAKLEGSDAQLKTQYVVVSAHLDHLGVGEPINGDRIYNGAMDDASGVAAVLDIAHRLKAGLKAGLKTGPAPRRSILFVLFTAEEKGLLGSHYFAVHPTVPKSSIVADLNFDMPLPLWPLKSVYLPGESESSLGADARAVGAEQGIAVVPDPLPDRNVFIRADQYSFVREGVPSLYFKFGFAKDTPEFQIEHDWRANRYHAPSDDLAQPMLKEEAVKLDGFVAAIARRVADAPQRPHWLPTSPFRKD